jgi:hypothetical protein
MVSVATSDDMMTPKEIRMLSKKPVHRNPKQGTPALAGKPLKKQAGQPARAATVIQQSKLDHNPLGPADMLQLHRQIGNQAMGRHLAATVQRQIIQQKGTPATVLANQIYNDFWVLQKRLGQAQMVNYTTTRAQMMNELSEKVVLDGMEGKSEAELIKLRDRLSFFTMRLGVENNNAQDKWLELQEEYQFERSDLEENLTPANNMALAKLKQEYDKTGQMVTKLGSSLVVEDLIQFRHMIVNRTHLRGAEAAASKEEKELEAAYDEFATLPNAEDPSTLGMVWDIVGWDSVGDFASDAVLTIATGGVGKIFKFLRKGKKARDRAKKLQKLKDVAKLRKAQKMAKALESFVRLLELLGQGLTEQFKWVKENWQTVTRKIATDLGAEAIKDKSVGNAASDALSRISKEYINSLVEAHFGKSPATEKKYIRLSFIALQRGKDESARRLYEAFLMTNGRRRLLTNIIHTGLITGSKLEIPKDGGILAKIAIDTAAEMAQDIVTAVPALDKLGVKDALETGRKYLQQVLVEKAQELL